MTVGYNSEMKSRRLTKIQFSPPNNKKSKHRASIKGEPWGCQGILKVPKHNKNEKTADQSKHAETIRTRMECFSMGSEIPTSEK